jgi:uncharacterized membrane protein (TIGR02234 family)
VIRGAQLLLIASALGLWVASRLSWVAVGSFDGLGHPKTATLTGATWSTALLPLALLLLAAALAGLAVRGALLRVLAVLVAVGSLGLGYLGISLLVMPDVAARGAALAGVPIETLVSSQRYHSGAIITVVAAVGTLLAAVLLLRAASSSRPATKYASPAGDAGSADSERGMWDALDEGRDPTDPGPGAVPDSARSDIEGR